ncbi:hypothetical protein L1S32_09215 [Methanogenium sp. S4BF]|uniref:hypothetical protein n=1 Tax=Methanogenium sp. S4BF TaxID=1789226 RepID=UPI002415D8E9|nr:hypothetical protein [Methanogenium sp. S4BF]WFN34020.1 hypothetical protein L1S32_09215 [Methanogenium sp. S4BF]
MLWGKERPSLISGLSTAELNHPARSIPRFGTPQDALSLAMPVMKSSSGFSIIR